MLTVGLDGAARAASRTSRRSRSTHFGVEPPPTRGRSPCRLTPRARAAMVERQLRGRDIVDERVLARDGARAARALRPRARARAAPTTTRRCRSARARRSRSRTWSRASARCSRSAAGERVLDVGTGSGYQAAVLAELGARGRTRSSASPSSPSRRARPSPPPATSSVAGRTSATGRSASPSARPFDAIAVAAAAPRAAADALRAARQRRPARRARSAAAAAQRLAGGRPQPRRPGRAPLGAVPVRAARRHGGLLRRAPAACACSSAAACRASSSGPRRRARAESLGLSGSVRNLPDGAVEAVFEGEPPSGVESMVDVVQARPGGSERRGRSRSRRGADGRARLRRSLGSPTMRSSPSSRPRRAARGPGAAPPAQLGPAGEVLGRRRERLRRSTSSSTPRCSRAPASTTRSPRPARSSSRSRTTTSGTGSGRSATSAATSAWQGMRFLIVALVALAANLAILACSSSRRRQDPLAGDRDRPRDAAQLRRQQALVVPPLALSAMARSLALAALLALAAVARRAPTDQPRRRRRG